MDDILNSYTHPHHIFWESTDSHRSLLNTAYFQVQVSNNKYYVVEEKDSCVLRMEIAAFRDSMLWTRGQTSLGHKQGWIFSLMMYPFGFLAYLLFLASPPLVKGRLGTVNLKVSWWRPRKRYNVFQVMANCAYLPFIPVVYFSALLKWVSPPRPSAGANAWAWVLQGPSNGQESPWSK